MHSILKVALTSWTRTFLIAMRKCTQFSSLHSFLSFAPTSRTRTRTHISNLLNLRKYTHFSNLHSFLKLRLFNYLFKCPHTFFNSLLKMHSFLKLALTSQSRIFSITYSNALNFRDPSYYSNLHSLLELVLISQTCTLSIPFIKWTHILNILLSCTHFSICTHSLQTCSRYFRKVSWYR